MVADLSRRRAYSGPVPFNGYLLATEADRAEPPLSCLYNHRPVDALNSIYSHIRLYSPPQQPARITLCRQKFIVKTTMLMRTLYDDSTSIGLQPKTRSECYSSQLVTLCRRCSKLSLSDRRDRITHCPRRNVCVSEVTLFTICRV